MLAYARMTYNSSVKITFTNNKVFIYLNNNNNNKIMHTNN